MEAGSFHADAHVYKPQAFRHNIFQPSSPPRVTTSPEAAPKRSHLHSLHHHHHHHKSHRHSNSHRAKDVVQSAVQLHPPTSFGDLLKQASRSKDSTPSHSRKGSTAVGDGGDGGLRQDGVVEFKPPKPARPEDVERERAKVKAREEELRSTLASLSDQSLKTSRKLDDTYYSILEKVAVLRQTIGSLQELSGLTKELHDNFQSDTKELTEDVHGQLDGFNEFKGAEEVVTGLEERIKSGRERASILSKRLEDARQRVQERSKVEKKWEEKTNRRVRILWGILGAMLGLVIIAICFQQFKPIHHIKRPSSQALNFGAREDLFKAPIPDDVKEAITDPFTGKQHRRSSSSMLARSDAEDRDELRIFDEL